MADWVEVGTVEEVERRRKTVVDTGSQQILVVWHDGAPYALANICVHKQRELDKGVVLNGRLVCAGHQWAFDLATGWCRERERCQPTYAARIRDGIVEIETVQRVPSQPQ